MSSNSFPIGFFGKLPIFADFISYNASGREVRTFHQWLQEGLYVCRSKFSNWPDEFNYMPGYSFLFNAGSMESFMVGYFGSSEDQSKRKYPFMIFSIIVQKKLGTTIANIPLAFSEFFSQTSRMINGGLSGMDTRGLTAWAQLMAATPDIGNIQTKFASQTLERHFVNIFGQFDDDRKYLTFQNIITLMSPMRNQNTQRFTLGLRLPLSRNKENRALETAFWLHVIFRYLGRAQTEPVFFWNDNNLNFQSYLLVYLRPPAPKHFAYLVKPDSESELVCNLDNEGRGRISEIKTRMNPQLKHWLDTASLSLADFVEKFSSI